MFSSVRTFIIALSIVTAATACTPNKTANPNPGEGNTADVFANRPIEAVPDLYVVTLSEPPILAVSTKTKTGWRIPANAKQRLLDEQAKFEANLKTIAPDAKIIYRYRMTLNAIAIFSKVDVSAQVASMKGVQAVNPALEMARPQTLNVSSTLGATGSAVNSVSFIGAERAHSLGFKGQGMRIGILDTGIDYTHAMLGGSGRKADYQNDDPSSPNAMFPNDVVVGGIDLVGTEFNAASKLASFHEPKIDANPLDEAGHGSHVAGTIAGHGDGVSTYDGVAPEAKLYAIKVFGKEGSTADAVVIAGFEFAADPNGDLNPDDQLDVINMSLGGGFGQPHILYTEAVKNLSRAGTFVVASAGNSGSVDYIVGAPSTADEALSVAASIDGSDFNWKFDAVRFTSAGMESLLVKAVEGPISKPIKDAGPVVGELVDIGDASVDLSDAQKAALQGKVALIVRGKVPFAEKLARAVAGGAIGAVVYNNDAKDPIPMGGEGQVEIPALMVSQAIGQKLLAQMKTAPVSIQFQTPEKIEEPLLVDTITDFSSKGPRSEDNLIKPEIAAPGHNIVSAAMGTGTVGVKMDGTSMAAPHMTGAIALIKQAHPDLTSSEIKALAMGTSKVLSKGAEIPITLQGAGRVQIDQAIDAPVLSETPAFSLGRVQLSESKKAYRTVVLKNLTAQDITLDITSKNSPEMKIIAPPQVTIPANGKATILARFEFSLMNRSALVFELDGRLSFALNGKTVLQIPAMAIRTQASLLTATLNDGAVAFTNSSPNAGLALAFNLLGQDARKPAPEKANAWKGRACDLQSVGYRILRKQTPNGTVDTVQFAFKVYDPVTTWVMCSVSALVDVNGDGEADQEVAGIAAGGLEGVDQSVFSTAVLDSAKAREVRLAYEKELAAGHAGASPDYTPAVLARAGMAPFQQSTLVVIEAPLAALKPGADGNLHLKFASQAEGGESVQADNFLGGNLGTWITVSPKLEDQAYYGMEEVTGVGPQGGGVTLTKGSGSTPLVLYYPLNEFSKNGRDAQEQILGN